MVYGSMQTQKYIFFNRYLCKHSQISLKVYQLFFEHLDAFSIGI